MPSLQPIGGAIRLNMNAGGAATTVPLADGGFAVVYRVAYGPDVFRLFDASFQPVSGEIEVTTDDFLAPQATALNDGRFMVSWLAQDQTIQASIYNSDGSLSSGPITLVNPTDPIYGLGQPRLVGNAFGGVTVIWQDNATINGVSGTVFIQSFDGDGNPVTDPISVEPPVVGTGHTSNIIDFRIALLGDGTTVVATQVQIDGVDSIMYSVNGGDLVSLAGGDAQFIYTNPQIAPLAAGGFVITYDFVNPHLTEFGSPDSNWTTGGSVFTSHGTRHDFAVGTTVTTTENGTFAVDPSVITPLADGGFVVTFEPLTSPLGSGYLVDAQQFDGFGNAVGPVVLVAPQGFLPSVATSASGVVLDTFQFGTGIFLRPFESAPTPLGPEPEGTSFGLNSVVNANSPGVAALSTGGFVVVYQGTNGDSYCQIYGYDRQPVGAAFLVAANGTQPVVAAQSNGTFLVAWSNGSQIIGAIYANDGTLTGGPFSMSGDPAALPVIGPALNATTDGGYSMAYETDLRNGGAHLVTIGVYDGNGAQIGPSVSQTFQPTNPLAPPKIAALEKQLFGSVTVIGVGDAIFAAIVAGPPDGSGNAGIQGEGIAPQVMSHAQPQQTPNTIMVSDTGNGGVRAGAEVASLNDGDIVVVWNEVPAGSATWQIIGQVMTSAGGFVGNRFIISTALPYFPTPPDSTEPPSKSGQIALSALPDGGFLVTYDSGNATLAAQRFDPMGNVIAGSVLVSGAGQANVVTTVLNDGTLVVLSDNMPSGGGTITASAFSVAALPMTWVGGSGTNLAVAANWDIKAAPDNGHTMVFGPANAGTLSGTASADLAAFSGQAVWTLSGAVLNLINDLTDQSTLAMAAGSLTVGGTVAIGVSGGAALSVSGAGVVSAASTAIGTAAGQTGTLTLSGAGTTWTDTGAGAAGGLRAGASTTAQAGQGVVVVSGGAALSGSVTDTFGVSAGSEGDLSISTGGKVSDAGLIAGAAGLGKITVNGGTLAIAGKLEMGQSAGADGALTVSGATALVTASQALMDGEAGTGSMTIQNQATVRSGGTIGAGFLGLDVGQSASGIGSIRVSGANSLLSNTGQFIIGDAGIGDLTILSGGTVTTAPVGGSGLPGAIIGRNGGATSSDVSVSGSGSRFDVGGLLEVGGFGTGGLHIDGGASVTAGSLDAGIQSGAVAQISVTGAGTNLIITGDAIVADDGTGVLSVLNGATFSANSLTIGSLGDSSGALVVSGAGSVINLTGSLNIGTALGVGDLTIGPGGAVHASVVNLQGQVVLEGGNLDPTVTIINQGQTAGGNGTIQAGFIVDEGVVQAGGTKPSQRLLIVDGTVVGGGTLTVNGTVQPSGPVGVLQINASGTLELTGPVLNAATTTFTDNLTQPGTYTINNSVVDVTFADSKGVLLLDNIAGFGGTITTFTGGDQFVIKGGVLSNLGVSNSNTLTFSDSGVNAGSGGIDSIIFGPAISAANFNIVNGNTVQVACFATGTRIATTRGSVAVESIHPGDRVCTVLGGDTAEVIWVGRRKVDCARHPDPRRVWPVRVSADAFGRGMPATDLYLSPDHAVYIDEVLIPIRLLINGKTVCQVATDRVTYHHVELAQHDVLLANGMPAESYLDTGDRARFSNGGGVVALHPDFSARIWESSGCAPLVQAGPVLQSVRRRVAAAARRQVRPGRERVAPGLGWPNSGPNFPWGAVNFAVLDWDGLYRWPGGDFRE